MEQERARAAAHAAWERDVAEKHRLAKMGEERAAFAEAVTSRRAAEFEALKVCAWICVGVVVLQRHVRVALLRQAWWRVQERESFVSSVWIVCVRARVGGCSARPCSVST